MAKKKSKKLTANQQAYQQQINRIKNAVKRAEKRGYTFSENVIPEQPKRITKKAIETLKRMTPNVIYSMAEYVDQETGEIISGFERRKQERKESARKATETRKRNKEAERKFWSGESDEEKQQYYPNGGDIIYQNVLQDFISKISEQTPTWTPFGKKRQNATYEASEKGRSTLLAITQRVIEQIGERELGWRLEQHTDEVMELITYVLYGSDGSRIASATSQLASIITGGNLTMSDLMEIAEEEEANEDWESPQ